MAQVQIQSMKEKHNQIIDWLFANPHARNLNELCERMNISRSWLSIVMNSDVFREEYTKRRDAHNGELHKKLVDKQLAVTLKALDTLDEALDDGELDPRLAFDIANKTAQNLGYSPRAGGAPVLTEEVERTREVTREVDKGVLVKARETLRLAKTFFDGPTARAALPPPD